MNHIRSHCNIKFVRIHFHVASNKNAQLFFQLMNVSNGSNTSLAAIKFMCILNNYIKIDRVTFDYWWKPTNNLMFCCGGVVIVFIIYWNDFDIERDSSEKLNEWLTMWIIKNDKNCIHRQITKKTKCQNVFNASM